MSILELNAILQARAGGAVQRCHTLRHQGSYSNAEHSWGVAMLILQLFPSYPELLKFALVHDIPEAVTGDVPATVKKDSFNDEDFEDYINAQWGLPQLLKLDPVQRLVLKSCDKLDLWFWAKEQFSLGNTFALEVIDNLERWFEQPGYLHPRAYTFWCQSRIHIMVPERVGLFKAMKEGYEKCQASK